METFQNLHQLLGINNLDLEMLAKTINYREQAGSKTC